MAPVAGKVGPHRLRSPEPGPTWGWRSAAWDVGVLDKPGFTSRQTPPGCVTLGRPGCLWGLNFLSCKMGSVSPLEGEGLNH